MRRAPLAPLGAGDPVVAAFLARVCALTPAEWERLGRAGVGRAGPARPPGAVGRWLGPGLARLSEALDDWSHGVNRRQYAPDAAWAGGAAAGPFGALGAALDAAAARPEVGRLARI